jgi:hypothetical protein
VGGINTIKSFGTEEDGMATASARTSKSLHKGRSGNGNGRKANHRAIEDFDDAADTVTDAANSFASAAQRQVHEASAQLRGFWDAASAFGPGAIAKTVAESNIEMFELFSRQAGAMAEWPTRFAKIRSPEQLFRAQTELIHELVADFQQTSQLLWSHWSEVLTASARQTSQVARRAGPAQGGALSHMTRRRTEGRSVARASH